MTTIDVRTIPLADIWSHKPHEVRERHRSPPTHQKPEGVVVSFSPEAKRLSLSEGQIVEIAKRTAALQGGTSRHQAQINTYKYFGGK